jgi:predicted enzyme related to lactoylglutathione lyase
MTSGPATRLVGVELFSDRAGESATFYSWLLGPGSGASASDWNPVSLLFEHGVCGIRVRGDDDGPESSWVPVVSTTDLEATAARAEALGYTRLERDRATYLTAGPHWLRVVPADPLPVDVDPAALGSTTVEWLTQDVPLATGRLVETLGLDALQVLDDPGDYRLLTSDGVLVLGVVDFSGLSHQPLPRGWLVYFDVPDLELTIARAADAGVEVLIPPTDEGYAVWAVLRDPFGVVFALASYSELEESTRMVRDASGEIVPIGMRITRHD